MQIIQILIIGGPGVKKKFKSFVSLNKCYICLALGVISLYMKFEKNWGSITPYSRGFHEMATWDSNLKYYFLL